MKKLLMISLLILITERIIAQEASTLKANRNQLDIGAGFGSGQTGISTSFIHNWYLGSKKKLFLGAGARFTNQFGKDIYYESAPASLAGESVSTDSIFINSPSVSSFNAVINLGYRFSEKFQVGFNIDAIGFSFGGNKNARFIGNGNTLSTTAKPTNFNILLVGNNDQGTLNSQFYLQYHINKKIGFKAAYQYLFTEYTTATEVQVSPKRNDRFRNRASQVYLGLVFLL
jgi:long-subunit fatty acid transport protein